MVYDSQTANLQENRSFFRGDMKCRARDYTIAHDITQLSIKDHDIIR